MIYPDDFINKIIRGDCLEVMKNIPDRSVNAIICDPPYGTTDCKWDTVIPFEPMWEHLKRIIKKNGAIVLFGIEPFSSALRMSNIKMYKYDWVWGKSKCGSPLTAKYRPLQKHENISIFGSGKIQYNPEMLIGEPYKRDFTPSKLNNHKFGIKGVKTNNNGTRFPDTILFFQQKWRRQDQVHPTQKPVALMKYLIKTYTSETEVILDFCIGSGTTAVACKQLNRNFIGIELEQKYIDIANERLKNENIQTTN
jgi:site-specific DNA-methyltransferase (adenine-specific)